jgi:hypothetical protein
MARSFDGGWLEYYIPDRTRAGEARAIRNI